MCFLRKYRKALQLSLCGVALIVYRKTACNARSFPCPAPADRVERPQVKKMENVERELDKFM